MPSSADSLVDRQPPSAPQGPQRMDIGRLVGVPIMSGLLLLNLLGLVQRVRNGELETLTGIGGLLAGVLTTAFYCLLIAAFLRRSPAKATHPSSVAAVAAAAATWLPFSIPLLPHGTASGAALIAANVLLAGGMAFSVWAIRYLDRSFSMIAQARRVVRSGPYAIVRHPLYTGELVALLGTALSRPTVWVFAVWAGIFGLQVYRASREETILAATLEDYQDYQQNTPQLIPLAVSGSLRFVRRQRG